MTGRSNAFRDDFPTKEAVAQYIEESAVPLGKRDLARAFNIKGSDRVPFKRLLKELEADGVIEKGRSRKLAPPASLPAVGVVDVIDIDSDGEVIARPATWKHPGPPPRIYVMPDRKGHPALGPGDRVLARLARQADGTYAASTIRRLDRQRSVRVVGVFRKSGAGGWIEPADRKMKDQVEVGPGDTGGAADGELVVAEAGGRAMRGRLPVRVVERLGPKDQPKLYSLIAIAQHGIPDSFPTPALEAAEAGAIPPLGRREDLRDVPLVTIDGADARDFDDAVFAEADGDPDNAGGWHLIVAIADVAYYVRPGDALDREAYKRGNSCYFPDRVVPMLPEALSNGLCSLRPHEDRACMVAHLWIDSEGRLKRHRFARGLMRSAARLTYEQVQAARNGVADETTAPLMAEVIDPLYGAYAALAKAREERGTLDLEIAEKQVTIDEHGRISAIRERQRLDSHKLIEEFMIAANVAAASELLDRNRATLLRVHEPPAPAKVMALNDFLEPLGYRIDPGQTLKPRSFMGVLRRAQGRAEEPVVNELVLRTQSQARYSPEPLGHFGLALPRYAHFTSPIRRYADLIVHRGLIASLKLGDDGLTEEEAVSLEETGAHISSTERRAAAAERDALDRYVAAWLGERVGQVMEARIAGVTRFGLFLRVAESGADGFVPITTLPDDFYDHDERAHALVGRSSRRIFRLGATVRAKLVEADGLSGSTVFVLVDADDGADLSLPEADRDGQSLRRPRSARPAPRGRAAKHAARARGPGKGSTPRGGRGKPGRR